ncbi:MAG: hypothetical protein AB4372_01390 [Xenococcus sp. (in: cyanobacteria)]
MNNRFYQDLEMMSKSKNNYKQKVPQWQLEKMRRIIADRWLETWEVVVKRDKEKRINYRFYNRCSNRDSLAEDL